jgi:formylglycine-generating enzyme required for sulfatase activity
MRVGIRIYPCLRRGLAMVAAALAAGLPGPSCSLPSARAADRPAGTTAAAEKFALAQKMFRLVSLPAGEFLMGTEGGDRDEQPITRVTISRSFWIGATEVTQGQYRAVMGEVGPDPRADHAVVDVSWFDAVEFCRRLTEQAEQSGWLPAGYRFALPTEAQWEYACRAGTTGDFAGDLNELGWHLGSSRQQQQPGRVAQKRANPWGLFDMHGNRWEWCSDWYGPYPGGSVKDPVGPPRGSFRVGRGGASGHLASRCRSAARNYDSPEYWSGDLGFRIVLSAVTPNSPSQ